MELGPKKLVLPPLNKSLNLDHLANNRSIWTKAEETKLLTNNCTPQHGKERYISIYTETSENIEFSLSNSPVKSQIMPEGNKGKRFQVFQRQILNSTSLTTRAKRLVPRLSYAKDNEDFGNSKKRIASLDVSEKPGDNYRMKLAKLLFTYSVTNKEKEPIKPFNNKTQDVDQKVVEQEEFEEIEENNEQMQIFEEVKSVEMKKKRKKGVTQLKDMVPLNLEEEKLKFFDLNYLYNPQFQYRIEDRNQIYTEPHKEYLRIAEIILDKCVREFGSDENYFQQTGGRVSDEEEITQHFKKYIEDHTLENYLNLEFSTKIVSAAYCHYGEKGKGTILIALPIMHREKRIQGLLNHEIGTHYIRKFNDRQQPWGTNRAQYNLKGCLLIEEGLAILNQTLDDAFDPEGKPYLFTAALHYYACYKSSVLSFQDLFKDLEKYIKDPARRWKQCIRVKRGISDTLKPGGMYKDQVYLRGAIKILQNRTKIDFLLLHLGKLNLEDLQRMIKKGLIKNDKMKIPNFLKDMSKYKAALDKIASFNFIDTLM